MNYIRHTLTVEQQLAVDAARVGVVFPPEVVFYPTLDVKIAETDLRYTSNKYRIYYNPEYLATIPPSEAAFVMTHEANHAWAAYDRSKG